MKKREKDLLDLLALPENRGYYNAVNDEGKRVGPLVGYAGTYETPDGSKQFVGERYWNFPRGAERNPEVLRRYFQAIHAAVRDSTFDKGMQDEIDCAFGCPEGGILPAYEFAREFRCKFSRADKRVLAVKTKDAREKSELILGRHTVEPNWRVAIFEDVVNNLSTTDKAIQLVESKGAKVVAIICMINRSPEGLNFFNYEGRNIEIIQAVMIPTPEYRQDDPYVAEDVAAGRVVWKPKDNWDELVR